jgi:hypothetical protein
VTSPRAGSVSPLFVLIEQDGTEHHHAEIALRAGFRVVSVLAQEASAAHIVDQAPSVVGVELSSTNPGQTWEFVRRFRQISEARLIPCLIYGHHLQADDIETAARAGALWLQLEPSDGARLIAAARGLVAAAGRESPAS